jgi:hypothetical protein
MVIESNQSYVPPACPNKRDAWYALFCRAMGDCSAWWGEIQYESGLFFRAYVQNSLTSRAYSYQRQSNARIIGLVFNMTDCLSEDDDEEHHPVFFTDFTACPGTRCTGRILLRSITEYLHFPTGSHPLPPVIPGNPEILSPVFKNRGSYGLIGL